MKKTTDSLVIVALILFCLGQIVGIAQHSYTARLKRLRAIQLTVYMCDKYPSIYKGKDCLIQD